MALPPGLAERLTGINAKLDRADEHLVTLANETRAWVDSEPNRYTVEVDYEAGTYCVRVALEKEPPIKLSIVCGDFVHCLRSALDYLVCGLAEKVTRRSAFPIFHNRGDFAERVTLPAKNNRPGPLTGLDLNGRVFAYVEHAQPYNGPHGVKHHPLWLLDELWNADKHRAILTMASSHAYGATLSVQGEGIEFIGQAAYFYDKPLEDSAEVIRGQFKPITEGEPKMQMQGELPLDVAFGEEGVTSESLGTLRNAANEVVTNVLKLADA